MIRRFKSALIAATVVTLFVTGAKADQIKELATEKGKPIPVGNFLSPRSDCSVNPGPIPFPVLRQKPYNGVVVMQMVVSDVAASATCPARKIPSIALIYIPKPDFVGTDSIQFEVETDNHQINMVSYRITVHASGNN